MNKLKIAIVGAEGKMGSLICQRLNLKYKVIKITKKKKLSKNNNFALVIDFANAESSVETAKWCASNRVSLIIGSTGQSEEQEHEIEKCSEFTPILKCSNFSIGVQTLFKLLKHLCYDCVNEITIFETHGKSKKDAPSGTANDIIKILKAQTNKKIQTLSERAGNGCGTHVIKFYANNEVIEIKHTAISRDVFVDGLEKCIEPMIEMRVPKLYRFNDIR